MSKNVLLGVLLGFFALTLSATIVLAMLLFARETEAGKQNRTLTGDIKPGACLCVSNEDHCQTNLDVLSNSNMVKGRGGPVQWMDGELRQMVDYDLTSRNNRGV